MKTSFLLAVTILLLASPLAADEPPPGQAVLEEDGSELWLVELSGPPITEGGQSAEIEAEHASFRHSATVAGLRFTERHAFRTLWNGFSIALDPGDLSKLESLDGVAAIHPVVPLTIPESEEIAEPQLLSALSMTGADVAQNELGLTGAGVRVGIIDTGIDYDHPSLGGDGVARVNSNVFPTTRVVAGWDFGQAFNPQADPYPDDDIGHGTHVAGIIGAHGAVRGVAPGVVFGAYRVTTADQMIAAMERALADGMQIVNISMGFPRQWPQYPVARAADRLVQRGVVVTASIGNEGGFAVYTPSAPAVGRKVIGVASFDNSFRNTPAFTVSPDQAPFLFTPATYSPGPNITPLRSGTYPLSVGPDVAGKVALFRPVTCFPCPPPDYTAARLAQEGGAVAVVLHAAILDFFPARVNVPAGSPPITIPVVSIKRSEAQQLLSRLQQGPVDITWHEALPLPVASGGRISSTSSWGPSPDLEMKPDLGAPGGFMHSTYPLELGGIANLAGTSMASAHVAGAVALMLESKPRLSPREIHRALQNSARPGPTAADPGRIEPVHHQGAGLIDVVAAIQAPIKVEPAALSLGESDGMAVARQITIENDSDTDLAYQTTHQPAQATGPNRYSPVFSDLSGLVTFSPELFTVPARGSITVDVSIAPDPGLEDHSLFGGYIVFTPQGEGRSYSVPYVGFKGDYQSIPTLTPTANGYPWLARELPFDLPPVRLKVSDGWTFTMTGRSTQPFVLWHLDHPPSRLRLEVFDAVTNKAWHRIIDGKWWSWSATATSAFILVSWSGLTLHGSHFETVPDGEYVMKMSVLRGLGDESNPAHWETWTSPRFFIDRPNLLVERLSLTRSVVQIGEEVGIVASIRNHGRDPVAAVEVAIHDGDLELHRESLDLAAGELRMIEVPWTLSETAAHRLRASVSTLTVEDDLTDNQMVLDVIAGEPIVGVEEPVTHVLALAAVHPNPFARDTRFEFSLPRAGAATLEVFDLQGRRLNSWHWRHLEPGQHSVKWNGETAGGGMAPAGALVVRLVADGRTLTRKAVRLP